MDSVNECLLSSVSRLCRDKHIYRIANTVWRTLIYLIYILKIYLFRHTHTHTPKPFNSQIIVCQPKLIDNQVRNTWMKIHWRQTKQIKFATNFKSIVKLRFIFMLHSTLLIPCLVDIHSLPLSLFLCLNFRYTHNNDFLFVTATGLRSFYLNFSCTFILFYRLIRMGICCLPKH